MNEGWYRDARVPFAMILHPMYVIIEEDTNCAERTPPWGCATIEDYVERLRRNLDAVEKYPEVKLCFEFSGMELEALAERDPDCARRMRQLADQGKVCFVNGTYAQPHLQILGSESVFRQFEEGWAAIERLTGYRVDTYAVDEPGVVEQLPQILHAFGYRFAHVPSGDAYAIRFLGEHELIGLCNPRKLDFVIDDEFTHWQGLDGALLPLYLSLPANIEADFREVEIFDKGREALYAARRYFPGAPAVLWNDANRDLYRSSQIKMAIGDMAAVTEEWLRTRLTNVDFVLLDRALEQRIRVCPPKSRARLYTYWSSAEGIRAEEQLRLTRASEQGMARLSALNALGRSLLQQPAEDLAPLWRRILWTQHHDAYWAGGAELRQKCVDRLRSIDEEIRRDSLAKATAIASNTVCCGDATHRLAVFDTCPFSRRDAVRVDCAFEPGEVGELAFPDMAVQVVEAEPHADGSLKRCRILADWESEGLGYSTRAVHTLPRGTTTGPTWSRVQSFDFENPCYGIHIGADGLFDRLYDKRSGAELLDCAELKGNEVRYRLESGEWMSSRRGPVVMDHAAGPVVDLLRVHTQVGELPLETTICFYHHLPRIDFQARITFARTELGVFWDDATKMNVYWPLSFAGEIRHDVPFGEVDGREHRPLLATGWVDMSDSRRGFAYLNRGTVKHWIKDRTLANVWAWGTHGNCFNNRNLPALFMKGFDLRLDGQHRIEYAVYPHGPYREAEVVRVSHAYAEPMLGVLVRNTSGTLPARHLALRVDDPAMESTAVEATSDGLRVRVYNASDRAIPPTAKGPWSHLEFRDLQGRRHGTVPPFRIGWLYAIGG